MLNIQEVANFLNTQLNEISDIGYNVVAEVGEGNNSSLINGILRTGQAKTTPIAGYVENRYSFVCELSVPTARTNKVFIKVQDAVNEFVETFDGTKVEFENGSATINCSLGKPENFKVEYNIGDCTPLYFTIDLLYTEGGVMSIERKWYLNGYEIPYESESLLVNKEGITKKVDFEKYTKTLLTGQTKLYKFKFPYQNTALGNMLMKDILDGDFKKQYTLKFVDGINYIENSLDKPPYQTKVSIYTSGDINSQVVSVGKFDLTFTDVDDGNTETKYYIGLISTQFDISGEDALWFPSRAAQKNYFAPLVEASTGWQQIEAPNLNNIYITNQVFPNNANYQGQRINIFDLARKNYAIIIVGASASDENAKWFFYGATNMQIGANGQVTYDLEEDTLQTIFYDNSLTISDAFIKRCHLSRFTPKLDNSGDYVFDFQATSPLFEKEEIQGYAKRPTQKKKLKVAYDTNGSGSRLSTWMNNNVSHWVYVYLNYDPEQTYTWIGNTSANFGNDKTGHLPELDYWKTSYDTYEENDETFYSGWIRAGVTLIAYPVMISSTKHIGIGNTGRSDILGTPTAFLQKNGNYSRVYAIKNSIMPPFRIKSRTEGTDYAIGSVTIDGVVHEYLALKTVTDWGTNISPLPGVTPEDWGCGYIPTSVRSQSGSTGTCYGLLFINHQCINDGCPLYLSQNMYKDTFTYSDIAETGTTAEPKLYNEDYSNYHIYYGGQTYDMPVSKTSNMPSFMYYEPFTPDITKFYLTYNRNSNYTDDEFGDNSIFGDYTKKDYTGLVGCLDLSMWYSQNNLDQWLATNKNNLQIFQNNQELQRKSGDISEGFSVTGGLIAAASGAIKQNPLAVIGGAMAIGSGVSGRMKTELSLETEAINRELTMDNMRQSPTSLSTLNSNVILMQNVDDFGIYLELQETIPFEKEQIRDYLKRYGYTVNRLGNIKNYLETTVNQQKMLTRNKYVYIQAIISAMDGVPMSTQERLNLKQRFENGIRFWRQATFGGIDYSVNNYERRLSNNI